MDQMESDHKVFSHETDFFNQLNKDLYDKKLNKSDFMKMANFLILQNKKVDVEENNLVGFSFDQTLSETQNVGKVNELVDTNLKLVKIIGELNARLLVAQESKNEVLFSLKMLKNKSIPTAKVNSEVDEYFVKEVNSLKNARNECIAITDFFQAKGFK